ncbi:MAG: NAD(P)/FAD-dependent oxidoreductase [Verrucomicrobiota bacterium]
MSEKPPKVVAVIGGGAAGFFAALTAAEADPEAKVTIYESGRRTLTKVKISGGGRCNVTHNCFEPRYLIRNYPRGNRELLGAFHRWQPSDTIQWFAERNVQIKAEPDGRMFPTTDDSQTIIDCFETNASRAGIQVRKNLGLDDLALDEEGRFSLELSDGSFAHADRVCIAAGSLKGSRIEKILVGFGHSVEPLAPSLFAFNIADKRTHGLSGISVKNARVKTTRKGSEQKGPILITHRGLSGPAILRLSAWEARQLQTENYHFDISINWLGDVSENQLRHQCNDLRASQGKTLIRNKSFFGLPRRLWERIIEICGIEDRSWSQLRKAQESKLIAELINAKFSVQGKTTNKEEFVTCGGVRLQEVNFKTMESRSVPGLYFAGECLDMDGVTGGFNFQAAWTTGRLAGMAMTSD